MNSKYPYDVWYNATALKRLCCNKAYTDKTILDSHNKNY